MRQERKTYRESVGFHLNTDIELDRLSKKVNSKDIAIIVQVHPLDDLKRFDPCNNQNVYLVKGIVLLNLWSYRALCFWWNNINFTGARQL